MMGISFKDWLNLCVAVRLRGCNGVVKKMAVEIGLKIPGHLFPFVPIFLIQGKQDSM